MTKWKRYRTPFRDFCLISVFQKPMIRLNYLWYGFVIVECVCQIYCCISWNVTNVYYHKTPYANMHTMTHPPPVRPPCYALLHWNPRRGTRPRSKNVTRIIIYGRPLMRTSTCHCVIYRAFGIFVLRSMYNIKYGAYALARSRYQQCTINTWLYCARIW